MAVNADKPHRWKDDIAQSVDFFNEWYLGFAPEAYRKARQEATDHVKQVLAFTSDLHDLSPQSMESHPEVLQILRMSTAPPIARDRLIGLTGVSRSLVVNMEKRTRIPPRMPRQALYDQLEAIATLIHRLADVDLLVWLPEKRRPTARERYRAATVIADRLSGAVSEPRIRNEQEHRQLAAIRDWLKAHQYAPSADVPIDQMLPGTYAARRNVQGMLPDGRAVNVTVDMVIVPHQAQAGQLPLLIEAKSAGDYANVNKRRKEEASKIKQLRHAHGNTMKYVLFLCGYFDSGYLGYEAAEHMDWVWEHRIEDLAEFGI